MNLFLLVHYSTLHRYSEEHRTEKECSQTIDWSELVKAAEAAQKQHGK